MPEVPTVRMTTDEYLSWTETQPKRHELVWGRVYAMAPERVRHARVKFAAQVALAGAIGGAGLACHVLPDGMTVRIDRETAFEPDALVYCGAELPGDATEVPEPVVVVDVLSPSTRRYDTGAKLAGYFALPSLRHYLLIDADRRVVIHHQRGEAEIIETRIAGSGTLRLHPPGFEVAVEALLGPASDPA